MPFWLSRDEAFDLAFKRDGWLWIKIPVAFFLAWTFFLPQLWKIGVLAIAIIGCAFVHPCPVGEGIRQWHLNAMFFSHIAMVFLVLWYAIYVFGLLCSPGWKGKLVAMGGLLLFPIVLIVSALVLGIGFMWIGVPLEDIWAYVDKWTPVPSWRNSYSG